MKRIAIMVMALMAFTVWAEPAEAQFRGLRGRGIGLNRGLRGRGFGGLGLLGLLGGGYGQPIVQQQLIPVPYGVQQQAFAAPSCGIQQQQFAEQLYQPQVLMAPQFIPQFVPQYGVGGSFLNLQIGRGLGFGRGVFNRGPVRGRIR